MSVDIQHPTVNPRKHSGIAAFLIPCDNYRRVRPPPGQCQVLEELSIPKYLLDIPLKISWEILAI
jgi:hypothetical protein